MRKKDLGKQTTKSTVKTTVIHMRHGDNLYDGLNLLINTFAFLARSVWLLLGL